MADSKVLSTFDAEICLPTGTAQLVRYQTLGPTENAMQVQQNYRLDLSLTPRPRNARGCWLNRWSPGRFERIGHLFLCPPGERLLTRGDGDSIQSSVVCQLHPESIDRWFEGEVEWTDSRLESGLDLPNDNVRWLLQRLGEELLHPKLASEALAEMMIGQVAIELGRSCGAVPERPTSGGLTPWRLRMIDQRLKDLRAPPTLSELAELCKLSIRHLTRGFRVSRGHSIGDYMAECRLSHAKTLLATDESIKSIAYHLGYASSSNFAFAFRTATGQSPREFRERVLGLSMPPRFEEPEAELGDQQAQRPPSNAQRSGVIQQYSR